MPVTGHSPGELARLAEAAERKKEVAIAKGLAEGKALYRNVYTASIDGHPPGDVFLLSPEDAEKPFWRSSIAAGRIVSVK